MRSVGSTIPFVILAFLAALGPALAAGETIETRAFAFEPGKPLKLEGMVGPVRLLEFRVLPDPASLIDHVLPPRGGQSRFSWLRYSVVAENASDRSVPLTVRVRLLDANGAVVDEFEFDGRVTRGRQRELDQRRLTMDYVLPLIARVEVTFLVPP